ncbi:hypothetical protein ml_206 [Mollivirus sibericum]|uniref:hypothetical protein n=1 Tax=Mollivirus sibericum TaxID=1678078 RepID=UPI0006B2DE09|nr:hypothetical protein ml_206 [Mollivirus sibericum]ALD62008.1 hypothetical protein ml_206 [Mollivirus sibericum]
MERSAELYDATAAQAFNEKLVFDTFGRLWLERPDQTYIHSNFDFVRSDGKQWYPSHRDDCAPVDWTWFKRTVTKAMGSPDFYCVADQPNHHHCQQQQRHAEAIAWLDTHAGSWCRSNISRVNQDRDVRLVFSGLIEAAIQNGVEQIRLLRNLVLNRASCLTLMENAVSLTAGLGNSFARETFETYAHESMHFVVASARFVDLLERRDVTGKRNPFTRGFHTIADKRTRRVCQSIRHWSRGLADAQKTMLSLERDFDDEVISGAVIRQTTAADAAEAIVVLRPFHGQRLLFSSSPFGTDMRTPGEAAEAIHAEKDTALLGGSCFVADMSLREITSLDNPNAASLDSDYVIIAPSELYLSTVIERSTYVDWLHPWHIKWLLEACQVLGQVIDDKVKALPEGFRISSLLQHIQARLQLTMEIAGSLDHHAPNDDNDEKATGTEPIDNDVEPCDHTALKETPLHIVHVSRPLTEEERLEEGCSTESQANTESVREVKMRIDLGGECKEPTLAQRKADEMTQGQEKTPTVQETQPDIESQSKTLESFPAVSDCPDDANDNNPQAKAEQESASSCILS